MSHIFALTQKYILDMLNGMFFHRTLKWGGIDQYNELTILSGDDTSVTRTEQRGCLLVANRVSTALRVIVTVVDSAQIRVCYRILGLESCLEVTNKKLLPYEYASIDFSVSDSNLSLRQDSSGTFSCNCSNTAAEKREKTFQLLQFMLDSSLITVDDRSLFEDRLNDILNYPPYPGDSHYQPIFDVMQRDA